MRLLLFLVTQFSHFGDVKENMVEKLVENTFRDSMGPSDIILKISNERVFFSPTISIDIGNTDIPYSSLRFHSHREIFWKAGMDTFNDEMGCLKVTVKDYNVTDISKFNYQKPKKEVKRLEFKKFDWRYLEPQLSSYTKVFFIEMLENADEPFIRIETPKKKSTSFQSHLQNSFENSFSVEFEHPFNKAEFLLGHITFEKHISELGEILTFRIDNAHVLPEFDSIKSWFSKKLKTPSFHVKAEIHIGHDGMKKVIAASDEIDLITPELIDRLKHDWTRVLTEEPKSQDINKSLFTIEEIHSQVKGKETIGNIFGQSDKEIIDILSGDVTVRNRKELEFLSGMKQSLDQKIRYTLKPNFGFLFFVQSDVSNYFIWELLNSNATYIWNFSKHQQTIDLQYHCIEKIISSIKNSSRGREEYLKLRARGAVIGEPGFIRLIHRKLGSSGKDGYLEWLAELESILK